MLIQGATVGPYQIVSSLGAGGMGEVYRARDIRLKRDVAIKVLPAELAERLPGKFLGVLGALGVSDRLCVLFSDPNTSN